MDLPDRTDLITEKTLPTQKQNGNFFRTSFKKKRLVNVKKKSVSLQNLFLIKFLNKGYINIFNFVSFDRICY